MRKTLKVELTGRELQVVVGIAEDKTYKEIATELGLQYETVKTYVKRIRSKLELSSKVSIGIWAHKKGLVK
jgi:two-component system, NarL family, response regulator LiaR